MSSLSSEVSFGRGMGFSVSGRVFLGVFLVLAFRVVGGGGG